MRTLYLKLYLYPTPIVNLFPTVTKAVEMGLYIKVSAWIRPSSCYGPAPPHWLRTLLATLSTQLQLDTLPFPGLICTRLVKTLYSTFSFAIMIMTRPGNSNLSYYVEVLYNLRFSSEIYYLYPNSRALEAMESVQRNRFSDEIHWELGQLLLFLPERLNSLMQCKLGQGQFLLSIFGSFRAQ